MRRVVITGIGIVSSLGNCAQEVARSLRQGSSGVEALPQRKAMGFNSCLAGTIKNFVPPAMPKKNARQMGLNGQLAVAAAQQALADAGLTEAQIASESTGVVIGNSGNMREIYQNCQRMAVEKKALPAMALAMTMTSSVSANLSVLLGTRGHAMTLGSACASGATAIGQAAWLIRLGQQDRVLAGGVQEGSWEFDCNFDALRAFSKRESDPTRASRPFDKGHDGTVPSAGCGIVLLEDYEQAKARGATIYAELIGYAANADGVDMTSPSGEGAVRCMKLALADAGIDAAKIDYVNAHATSTPMGDVVEAQAIAQVLGPKPLVSSTKSMTGHEIAAAGSNELIYTLLMMRHGFVAPSINIEEIDQRCRGINILANQAADATINTALSNSFGFGGVNATLIVKRVG